MEEQELNHHGVKGMKWGVRRKRDSGGTDRAARKQQKREIKSDARQLRRLTENLNTATSRMTTRHRYGIYDSDLDREADKAAAEYSKFVNDMNTKKGAAYVNKVVARNSRMNVAAIAAGGAAIVGLNYVRRMLR